MPAFLFKFLILILNNPSVILYGVVKVACVPEPLTVTGIFVAVPPLTDKVTLFVAPLLKNVKA